MRIITRTEEDELLSERLGTRFFDLSDAYFDGVPLPRTIRTRTWIPEGTVHRERILSTGMDSTRYFVGAQNCIVRDDNRRTTWVAVAEPDNGKGGRRRLMLHKFPGSWPTSTPAPPPVVTCLTEDGVWRYHIALNKFNGEVTTTWITRSNGHQRIWLDGRVVETEAAEPDFPFLAFSQPPIGHVATSEPPFSVFGYKCRKTGHLYLRRMSGGELEPEVRLDVGPVIGGVSLAISGETVLARIDRLKNPSLVPALVTSTDSGRTFGEVRELDVSQFEEGFSPVPGFTEPVMDVGGHLHAPIHVSNGSESVALNFVVREDALVEAIRIDGSSRISNSRLENLALSQASQEVFPATLGNPNAFGNGITDGHGLIMVLSAAGRLFSSNSSAGGMFYPEKALLNYEMPLVHTFASTECYTSGMLPNYVSMDYVYIEADAVGQPISSDLHFETWDMPLPIPEVVATARGSRVNVKVIADADMEPGQVTFSFSDPSIRIADVKVTSLRTAEIETDARHLEGRTLRLDVDSLFHRHYAEAVIEAG